MKKRIICFVTVILLMLSVSVNVFAADTANNNESADTTSESTQSSYDPFFHPDLDITSLGPTNLLQLILGKLPLDLSKSAKEEVIEILRQISITQNEQRLVASYLNTAKELQSESNKNHEQTSQMPDDMNKYLKDNNFPRFKSDDSMLYNNDEWEIVILLLENRLMKLGETAQKQMISLQNFYGKYNLHLQGTNQTTGANNTITTLARGQSMYGDSEVGLAVTALVVGLLLGCVIMLAVQNVRRKKSVE